jgi:ketosteroid isomerase-like protein
MNRGARTTVEQVLHAGRTGDIDTFLQLMAPDGYLEWPYRPPGTPARIQGHPDIRAHLTAVGESVIKLDEHRDVVIHETSNPETIIAEYAAHGTVRTTGAPFHQQVIAVFQIRDGQILKYRDYINPLPLIEALTSGGEAPQ